MNIVRSANSSQLLFKSLIVFTVLLIFFTTFLERDRVDIQQDYENGKIHCSEIFHPHLRKKCMFSYVEHYRDLCEINKGTPLEGNCLPKLEELQNEVEQEPGFSWVLLLELIPIIILALWCAGFVYEKRIDASQAFLDYCKKKRWDLEFMVGPVTTTILKLILTLFIMNYYEILLYNFVWN